MTISASKGFLRGSDSSLRPGFVLCLLAMLLVSVMVFQRAARADQPMFIMNSDGTNLRQLVHLHDHPCTGSPMWTRDGKYILLDAWRQKEGATHAHIYQVNADGTWPVDLGPGAMPSRHPSEKGQLATHYYGDMRGVWLGTEKKIQIDPDSGSPRWHPYEPKIAYVKWSGGIAMRSFTGGELGEEEIIVPAEYAPYVGFSWAPDGKAIAFYSNRNGNDNSELLVLNVANPESEPEVKDSGKVGWILSWSPDGKKIAYSNYCEDTKTRQLFIVAPSTNDAPYRLEGQDKTRHNGSPAWSPDGKQIVFSSSEAKKAVVKD